MTVHRAPSASDEIEAIGPGSILVNRRGQVRVVRSRTATDDGWNCADGAPIDDAEANDPDRWQHYVPEALAADLRLAGEVRALTGHKYLVGGIATWDACSGRPCVLPKLAKVARDHADGDPSQRGTSASWI